MNTFILWASHFVESLGIGAYFFLALVTMFEALPVVGLLIPGVIIMIITGIFSAWGIFDFKSVLIIASAGALLGDIISYVIGKSFKNSFKQEHKYLKPEYLERAKNFYKRWGISSIVFGRFIGPLRAMITVVAGITGMKRLRFIVLSAIGSILFVVIYVGFGFLAASAWQSVEAWSSRIGFALLALVVSLICLWWLKGFIVRQGKELRTLIASLLNSGFDHLIHSRFWKAFTRRAACFTHWFEKRFNPRLFKGLPLLSLAVLVLLLFVASWWLGIDALDSQGFWSSFDLRLRSIVMLFSDSRFAVAAFLVTVLGSVNFIIASSAAFTFWLLLENRRSYSIGLWLSVLGGLLSSTGLKYVFAKPRPDPTYLFENLYAYPSVHATLAFVFIMFFAYYAIRAYPRWSRNVSLVFFGSIVISLIGASRVYLGVHYPTDVLGGFLLGGAWFIIGVITQRSYQRMDEARRLRKFFQLSLLSGIGLLLLIFYINQAFDKGVLKNFYYALPTIVEQRQDIDLKSPEQWPPVTENLRGGRLRPVLLIRGTEEQLRAALQSNGWTERSQPQVPTLLQYGASSLMKRSDPSSPVRPRFWHNHPNDLAFSKNIQKEETIIRLWKTQIKEDGEAFIAELSQNPTPFVSEWIQKGVFKNSEQRNINYDVDIDKDNEPKQISIYILSL